MLMRNSILPFLSLFLLLVTVGCEKDNFDTIEETGNPTDPVIIEENPENYVKYVMPDGRSVTIQGRGLFSPTTGQIAVSTAAVGAVECGEDGNFGSISASTPGMILIIDSEPEFNFLFALGHDLPDVEYDVITTVVQCPSALHSLTITEFDPDFISGHLTAEFFGNFPDVVGPDFCDEIVSLGKLEIEFAMELVECN